MKTIDPAELKIGDVVYLKSTVICEGLYLVLDPEIVSSAQVLGFKRSYVRVKSVFVLGVANAANAVIGPLYLKFPNSVMETTLYKLN